MDDREQEETKKLETHQQLFKILESLNRVFNNLKQLSQYSPETDSSAIKTLLELRKASSLIVSAYPSHFSLSQNLSKLIDLVQELHNSKPSTHGLKSFLVRRVKSHETSRLANSIVSELQELIESETVLNLTKIMSDMRFSSKDTVNFEPSDYEDKLFVELTVLQNRLSRGFDISLQHLLLKSNIFADLEWVLCNPLFSKRVREKVALTVKELVLFNKDVFVGSVLVGGTVKALISMDSLCSLQVLSSLIKAIRSPLVDELESCGGILKIVSYLSSDDLEMTIVAMDCVMEIAYYGRKKAAETMISCGLIKRMVELQKSDLGADKGRHAFAGCLARFAVQLEVGEGLRQREKRAFKQQILSKVREACDSDAECATIVAEVLWGSSP